MLRFSITVIPGKSLLPSGTWPIPSLTMSWVSNFSILVPSKTISPETARSRPEMVLRMVLFPAPFAPMSVTIFPSSMSKETFRTSGHLAVRHVHPSCAQNHVSSPK